MNRFAALLALLAAAGIFRNAVIPSEVEGSRGASTS
jgi:hypothetical protein